MLVLQTRRRTGCDQETAFRIELMNGAFSRSDMTNNQVDHLLLIVGRNPLPNAVAGQLLAKPDGVITLLHSEGTSYAARKLREWFVNRGWDERQVRPCEVSESDAGAIGRRLLTEGGQRNKGVLSDHPDAMKVGLHYTGGTKAMAVHVYRAVEQWAKSSSNIKEIVPRFSYLDARTLSLIFDPEDLSSGRKCHSEPVGLTVQMTLDNLFELHGWESYTERFEPLMLPMAQRLLTLNQNNSPDIKAWTDWKYKVLSGFKVEKKEDKVAREKRLGGIVVERLKDDKLCPFWEELCAQLGIDATTTSFRTSDAAAIAECTNGQFCNWLDGGWLESVVLQTLLDLRTQRSLPLHDIRMNMEPESSIRRAQDGRDITTQFEIDVIALRGYQLFAFSCGTDSKRGPLKTKLFEAYFRARQIGGDEARVALVCTHSDPERLEDEAQDLLDMNAMSDLDSLTSGVRRPREEKAIRVFGRPDLANLDKNIAAWIEFQSKEK